MATDQDKGDGPVAVVVQCRIADEGFASFVRWNGRVGDCLRAWPGFLGQDVLPPQPPATLDWVTILRFAGVAAARAWLQSGERRRLLDEVRHYFSEPEGIHILPDASARQESAVSAVISFQVPAGLEDDFLAWQARTQTAEAAFKGFLRHKIERPIAGLHDDWIIVLSFDNDANLSAWLNSPEREALLHEGERFNAGLSVRRASYGFNFWFPASTSPQQAPSFILKSNLLVLLVLYPIVYLWGTFVSAPLIDARGVPFWLSLFIGNLVSTQLLGWWIVPAAFKAFDWWLAPRSSIARQIAGYALVTALYGIAMAVYAALLAWNWGKG
jgi:antibiotic biosynthesis monooxygenase (ABM) superfamily enzyme